MAAVSATFSMPTRSMSPMPMTVVPLSDMAPRERATLRGVAREVTGVGRKLGYLASTSAFR